MDAKRAFLVFGALLLTSHAASSEEGETCSFLDKHLVRAIHDFIGKLPAERAETINRGDKAPAEAPQPKATKFKFSGLNTLRPFGPFFTFCPNGSHVVQFDLVNEDPLVLLATFTGDGGKEHQIESRAFFVRFTAQFAVDGTGENVKLHHRVNMPVSLAGLSFGVKGADKETDEAFESFTRTLPPLFLYDLWHGMLYSELEELFSELSAKAE